MNLKLNEISSAISILEMKETLTEEENKELDKLYQEEEKLYTKRDLIYKRARSPE